MGTQRNDSCLYGQQKKMPLRSIKEGSAVVVASVGLVATKLRMISDNLERQIYADVAQLVE